MKYIIAILIYMTVSGLFGGIAFNHQHEKCNTTGGVSASDAYESLLWPVSIGYTMTIDDKYYKGIACDKTAN